MDRRNKPWRGYGDMPSPRETLAWLRCVDQIFGGSQAAALDAVAELRELGGDLPADRDWPEWSRKEMLAVTAALRALHGGVDG